MSDLFFVAVATAFFVLTWGLMRLCEILMTDKQGDPS